jgi:hypothetical protein
MPWWKHCSVVAFEIFFLLFRHRNAKHKPVIIAMQKETMDGIKKNAKAIHPISLSSGLSEMTNQCARNFIRT